MSQMPIEVIEIGDISSELVKQSLDLANSLQNEFVYLSLPDSEAHQLRVHTFTQVLAPSFLDTMEQFRNSIRGFHPFLIAFIDARLAWDDTFVNVFSSCRDETGVAVATIYDVPDLIIPKDRMISYFLYFLARNTLQFISPNHRNHDDTRGCIFDLKVNKRDLLKSMKARSLCDICRTALLSSRGSMSPVQLRAIETMFAKCGELLEARLTAKENERKRPRVFIGSSSEGLHIAEVIQLGLENVAECTIWSQGVFGLSGGTLETLVNKASHYDYAILVLTPDDVTTKRDNTRNMPRDNVLFELGLFMGVLGRSHTFIIYGREEELELPTDLAGITAATYSRRSDSNLQASLGPVCTRIKSEMGVL